MTFKNFFPVIAVVIAGSLWLAGCNDAGDIITGGEDDDPVFADNVTVVESDITGLTTWDASRVYYIGSDISVTGTLVIPAGTVIKFGSEGSLEVYSSGTINAVGTVDTPIIFTSVKDDGVGGDSTLNGAEQPLPGSWNHIGFGEGTSGSVLDYCRFYYGGGYYANASTIWLFNAGASITNCLFAFNMGQASYSDGYIGVVDAGSAGASTIIENNRFYGNILPLSINGSMSLDDSNYFSSTENDPVTGQPYTNTYNGVFVNVWNGINSVTWSETEAAFVPVETGIVTVNYVETLTLGSGVVLKFMEGAELDFDTEEGASINYTAGTVKFTSYRDDNLKGDTNGDGSATEPDETNGNWEGVWYWNMDGSEWERTFLSDCLYLY